MNGSGFATVRSWIGPVGAAALPAALILIAAAAGNFLDFLTEPRQAWQALLGSALAAGVVLLAIAWGLSMHAAGVSRSAREDELSRVYDQLATIRESLETYQAVMFEWMEKLRTPTAMARFEEHVETEKIWVATVDLDHDVEGGLFAKVVAANLGRGTMYRFLVPDEPGLRAKASEIEAYYGSANLSFAYVARNRLTPWVHTNVVVYNPDSAVKTIAFQELAISQDTRGRLWAELESEAAHATEGYLQELFKTVGANA